MTTDPDVAGRVATITPRQAAVLDAARALLDAGARVTEVAVGSRIGIGPSAVRDYLADLRRIRLLPCRGRPAIPATVVVVATPRERPGPAPSDTSVARVSARASRAAERQRLLDEAAGRKARFEAAARDFEALRTSADVPRASWNWAHDRLQAAIVAYARSLGAAPCVCDDVAYYPNPSGDGFVRKSHPRSRKLH